MRGGPHVSVQALLVVASAVAGARVSLSEETVPSGSQALFEAVSRSEQVPLDEGIQLLQRVIEQFPGTTYAGEATLGIGSLYLKNKRPDLALANAESVIRGYAGTPIVGRAIRRKFVTLAFSLDQPQEALDFLDEAVESHSPDIAGADRMWLPTYRYDAFCKLGDKDGALSALDEGLLDYPQTLSNPAFFKRYRPALRQAGRDAEALAAAKGAFACCRVEEEAVATAAQQVVDSLIESGDLVSANGFVAAQEDAKAANPLAEIPWPAISEADLERLMGGCLDDTETQVCALLYFGRYDAALNLAAKQLAESKDAGTTSACVQSIARCFKGKDLSLLRANAFLTYVATGEGDNPLAGF